MENLSFAELCLQRAAPALLFLSAAVLCSLLLQPTVPNAYVALLLVATVACGWVRRRQLGMVAGVLASICVAYFFLGPTGSFRADFTLSAETGLFLSAAVCVGWLQKPRFRGLGFQKTLVWRFPVELRTEEINLRYVCG